MLKEKLNRCADQVKKNIVKWLLDGGMGFDAEFDAVGNEVLYSVNRRRADMLILSNQLHRPPFFHALEIKGELDRLDKLEQQIQDYCRVFDKVSVVITPKYKIEKVLAVVPETVGIIRVNENDVKILKDARINDELDKFELLKFLPKNILNKLLPGKSRLYVDELRDEISKQLNVTQIHEAAHQHLRTLYNESFQTFLRSIEEYTFVIDDIMMLSYQSTDLNVPFYCESELVS